MVKVIIDNHEFMIKLNDSKAAKQFQQLLPLTISMEHINGNEVYKTLNHEFHINNQVAGKIKTGDLKLWAGNGLVLFYKNFNSSYSYTNLGEMVDSTGLEEALKNTTQIIFTQE